MKNIIGSLSLLLACIFALPAQADSKNDIYDLLGKIDAELRYYNQSSEKLDQVKNKLEDALRILRNSENGPVQNCVDFAYDAYVKDGWGSSTALDKAGEYCKKVSNENLDLDIVKFFYPKYVADGWARSTSLDKSAERARGLNYSHLECLKSSVERYMKDGWSIDTAIDKAIQFCTK